MDSTEFRQELEQRLGALEDSGVHDPARTDLPARDLVALLVVALVVIGALLAWGYPW